MVEVENNEADGWSSEEEEMNFGGTMGVTGAAAIRSATFAEKNPQVRTYNQPVSALLWSYLINMGFHEEQLCRCQ